MEARMFIIFKLTLVFLKCDTHVHKRIDMGDGHSNLKWLSNTKGLQFPIKLIVSLLSSLFLISKRFFFSDYSRTRNVTCGGHYKVRGKDGVGKCEKM